jgi:hypothetical protein
MHGITRGAVKKCPDFFAVDGLEHHEFVPPGQSVTVRVLQRKRRDKWRAGTVVFAPSHTPLVVSSPNHRALRISLRETFGCSLLENRPQGDTFPNHEVYQVECDGRTPEDFNGSLPLVLQSVIMLRKLNGMGQL